MLPPATQRTRGGRPRTVDMRAGLHTLCSLHRRGCPWERLPHAVLPTRTVSASFSQWRDDGTWTTVVKALRAPTRVEAGREPTPRAAGLESPAVKTPARGGAARGEEGGTHMPGRTRPVVVDTRGLVRALRLPRAGLDDGVAAPPRRGQRKPGALPRLRTSCADQQDHQHALDAWMAAPRAGWRVAIALRPEGTTGGTPLEQRWVIARTHAWHGRYRRNSKDDASSVESRTARRQMRQIHLLLHRRSPCGRPAFHYRTDTAYYGYDRAGMFPDSL
jgi:putative transposase